MRKIHERLYTGGLGDCFAGAERWAVVHACRHPCHRRAARRLGAFGQEVPWSLEEDQNLYLDLVDGPESCFSTAPLEAFLDFADRHWGSGLGLLIHCNQGRSRGPSLALLFLAKRAGELPTGSYAEAGAAFSRLDPDWSPGDGIRSFLHECWHRL